MATFKIKAGAVINGVPQNKAEFTEYDIPDEIIREYRTFVETGCAAVIAKAAVIILGSGDAKDLVSGARDVSARIMD